MCGGGERGERGGGGVGELESFSSTKPVIYLPLYISFLFKVAFLKILPLKGPVSHKDGLS